MRGHEYFHLQLSSRCNILAIVTSPASTPHSSEREAALRLLSSLQRARRTIVAYSEGCAARLGLSFPELLVLHELVHTAHPTVVSRSTGIPPSTISRLLRSLEGRGLVQRAVDSQDLRRFRVSLTREGKRAVARSRECLATSLQPKIGRLGMERVDQLFAALSVLEADEG